MAGSQGREDNLVDESGRTEHGGGGETGGLRKEVSGEFKQSVTYLF